MDLYQTKFLGILCHKLSTIMLIRRSTGCFKGHFLIFEILGNYFIMARVPLWHVWWGLSHRFLCYQLKSYQILLTADRSYQGLKDATLFGLISDKSAEKSEGKNINICQFSILATWLTWSFMFICKLAEWHHFCLICIQKLCVEGDRETMENWKNLNISTLISECSYQIRRQTRWHPLESDKSYFQLKGFEKIPSHNREIKQSSSEHMFCIMSWNQSCNGQICWS